jgi:hypothetical protein
VEPAHGESCARACASHRRPTGQHEPCSHPVEPSGGELQQMKLTAGDARQYERTEGPLGAPPDLVLDRIHLETTPLGAHSIGYSTCFAISIPRANSHADGPSSRQPQGVIAYT